jgi:hypothetical protein
MLVLGLWAGHLLLIRTNFGYGTELTAACACHGCSASGLVWFFGFGGLYLRNTRHCRIKTAFIRLFELRIFHI